MSSSRPLEITNLKQFLEAMLIKDKFTLVFIHSGIQDIFKELKEISN